METCPNCTRNNGSSHGVSRAIRNAIGFGAIRNGKTINVKPEKLQRAPKGLNLNTIDLSSVEIERKKNGPFLNNLRNQVR